MRAPKVKRLSRDEEKLLFDAMKQGDRDARETLILSVLPFVIQEATAFFRFKSFQPEELISEAVLAVIETIDRKFDPESAPLMIFVKRPIYWRLQKHVSRYRNVIAIPDNPRPNGWIQESIVSSRIGSLPEGFEAVVTNENQEHCESIEHLKHVLSRLPIELMPVLEARFLGQKTIKEVSEKLGIGKHRVREQENRILRILKAGFDI